jgi:hypothetical protein
MDVGDQEYADLLAHARELRQRWDGGWLIDGRSIGVFEMHALSMLTRHELQEKRDSGECCCDEGPWTSGQCRCGPGQCELFTEATNILWRIEHG